MTDVGERHLLEQCHLETVEADTGGVAYADEATSERVDRRRAEIEFVDVAKVGEGM